MQKRRVYAPFKMMRPGRYVVWTFLKSGREYVWKGFAANEEVAEKLAQKRLGGKTAQMWMTSRL